MYCTTSLRNEKGILAYKNAPVLSIKYTSKKKFILVTHLSYGYSATLFGADTYAFF